MFGHDAISEAYIMSGEHKKKLNDAEEVYGKYTDTAGNLHWVGTKSGEHILKAEEQFGDSERLDETEVSE